MAQILCTGAKIIEVIAINCVCMNAFLKDAEIDEIQRYWLAIGPLNYPSILFWLVALGALGGLFLAVLRRVQVRGKGGGKEKQDPAVAPEPAPEAVVSVIPLEDNEEPEK